MSRPLKSVHGEWTSRWAFILAATGAAVGLGNIWKFPYIAGEYGGGAFVLVYLACIFAIGVPIMMAEILIGRRGRQNPFNSLASLAEEEKASSLWKYLGFAGVLAGFLILSYYSVIAGQAIYSKENNEGMFFPEEDNQPPPPHSPEPDETVEKTAKKPASRPSLKVVK